MGWKSSSKPDTTQQENLARTQTDIALEQAQMAREERAFQQTQMDRVMPLFEQQVQASIASQQTADKRSEDQWSAYLRDFQPAEAKLASQAMNYDTPERRAAAAAEAVAGVDSQFSRVQDAQRRDLGRAGISLDSGRALTLDMAGRYGQAKAAASADRTARQQIENTGMNLVDNVAKLGRGLAGTSLQAQGLGLNAGTAATGQMGQQQGTYNASMNPALQSYSGASGALGSAGNMYGNIAQQQAQARQSSGAALGGLGSLAGTLLTAGKGSIIGSMLPFSDPKTKKVHGKVSGKKALSDIESKPVYDWTYKKGVSDEGRHQGRMAGDGDPKIDGLHRIDLISEVGKQSAAIAHLAKEIKGLKGKSRSLADAQDIDAREVA
jgi:hypothetical protein